MKETFSESYVPTGESVIVKDYLKTNRVYRPAYKFDIYAHHPLSRNYLSMDAITGEILDKDSRIHEANASGTATTHYSRPHNINTDGLIISYKYWGRNRSAEFPYDRGGNAQSLFLTFQIWSYKK